MPALNGAIVENRPAAQDHLPGQEEVTPSHLIAALIRGGWTRDAAHQAILRIDTFTNFRWLMPFKCLQQKLGLRIVWPRF